MAERMQVLERLLKALANKRRLAIVTLLRQRKEATVGEIAEHIRLSFRSTSRHLAVLVAADILLRRQHDLYVYYRLNPDLPKHAKNILTSLLLMS